jgi:hypothetical protein
MYEWMDLSSNIQLYIMFCLNFALCQVLLSDVYYCLQGRATVLYQNKTVWTHTYFPSSSPLISFSMDCWLAM